MECRYNSCIGFILLGFSYACAADSFINYGNNANTGNIVIDGKVVGESANNFINGSGKNTRTTRKTANYRRIVIDGAFAATYHRDASYSLVLSGDDNIVPWITTSVNNGTLLITTEKSYSSQSPLTVTITSPVLETIAVDGSTTLHLNDVRGNTFIINVNGSSEVSANGRVANLRITLSGSGEAGIKDLIADNIDVYLNGSGNITVTAKKKLTANISGAGDIVFYGDPETINKQVTGVGDIIPGE